MDKGNSAGKYDSVYSNKVKAGRRRTYFFDVRQTKGEDYYITLTESTRKFNGNGYERHKIFLYKEDFNRFLESLEDTINHIKTELLPDYDYDEFTRKHEEYEKNRDQDNGDNGDDDDDDNTKSSSSDSRDIESEEDMSW